MELTRQPTVRNVQQYTYLRGYKIRNVNKLELCRFAIFDL